MRSRPPESDMHMVKEKWCCCQISSRKIPASTMAILENQRKEAQIEQQQKYVYARDEASAKKLRP